MVLPKQVDYDTTTREEFHILFKRGVLSRKKQIRAILNGDKALQPKGESLPYEKRIALISSVDYCIKKGWWEGADEALDNIMWYDIDKTTALILSDILEAVDD